MMLLKILAVGLGLTSSGFGYLIFFQKKYSLINGFEEDFKSGRKDENSARRVGIIEFVLGISILIAGMALVIFDW